MEVQKPFDSEHFGEFPQQFLKLNALEEASRAVILRKRINLHRNVKNPNRNDPRRLFQVYKADFMWSPSIPYGS